MFSVLKDNIEIGITENPRYIRLQDNGTYGLCDKAIAHGIVFRDVAYHVWGMPEIDVEGVESVTLQEIEGGERMREMESVLNALLGANGNGE